MIGQYLAQCTECYHYYTFGNYRNRVNTLCGSCRAKKNGRSRCVTCERWYTRPKSSKGKFSTAPNHLKYCYNCRP